jgi:hypothetical protein
VTVFAAVDLKELDDHSNLAHTDTPEAGEKRRQRTETGTVRCFGRAKRRQTTLGHLNVPVPLSPEIVLTGAERWIGGATT